MLRMRWRAVAGLSTALVAVSLVQTEQAASAQAVAAYSLVVSGPGEPSIALYAEERGQGAPVVLLHGLGGSTKPPSAEIPLDAPGRTTDIRPQI